jgi:predicted MFS family arabinose efflux permease
MSQSSTSGEAALVSPTSLWSADLIFTLATVFALFTSHLLVTAVAPVVAANASGSVAMAGYANSVFNFLTVGLELVSPRLMKSFTHKQLFFTACLIHAAALLVFAVAGSNVAIMLVCMGVRGAAFGVAAVMGPTMVTHLVPASRHGEALGYYGLTVGVPLFIGPFIGLTVMNAAGYSIVFVGAGILCASGALSILGVRRETTAAVEPASPVHLVRSGVRQLVFPGLAWSFCCMAFGAIISLGALAMPTAGLASGPIFFAVVGFARSAVRWVVGRQVDKGDPKRTMLLWLVVILVGLTIVAAARGSEPVLVGALLYGAAFGAMQVASYVGMLRQAEPKDYGNISAIWNLFYDSGSGIGGIIFGLVAASFGFTTTFWALPALPLLGLGLMAFTRWEKPKPA